MALLSSRPFVSVCVLDSVVGMYVCYVGKCARTPGSEYLDSFRPVRALEIDIDIELYSGVISVGSPPDRTHRYSKCTEHMHTTFYSCYTPVM